MTGAACCFTASHRAVLIDTKRNAGFLNNAHEPVVKSWRRVPTAITTSASSAIALAAGDPLTPIGPA
jgi:hypothetical protein